MSDFGRVVLSLEFCYIVIGFGRYDLLFIFFVIFVLFVVLFVGGY